MAVREGFEPSIGCPIHAFQACSLSHSDTSPLYSTFNVGLYRLFQLEPLKNRPIKSCVSYQILPKRQENISTERNKVRLLLLSIKSPRPIKSPLLKKPQFNHNPFILGAKYSSLLNADTCDKRNLSAVEIIFN